MTDLIKTDSSRAAVPIDATNTCVAVQPVTELPTSTSGSIQDPVEADGVTTFAAPPAPAYRYKISLKSGKLRIWLEDCQTKQQWCTSDLTIDNYVDINNAALGTEASDYIDCFRALLDKVVEDANDFPRTFKRIKGDAFRLEISMKVQVLTRTRMAIYSFDLEPISVERIDVLESRMRDLQDEVRVLRSGSGQNTAVEMLQNTVDRLLQNLADRETPQEDEDGPIVIKVQAAGKVAKNRVCWSKVEGYSNGNDGIIRNLEPGTYLVVAVISYVCSGSNYTIDVMKGPKRIMHAYCTRDGQSNSTSTLTCISRMDKEEELSFECPVGLKATSYLTLTRLGQ